MERINPFSSQHLEAACKVLADTQKGLTGSQIGRLLQEIKIIDTSPEMTKWKRLFNALAEAQNKYQVGNHLIMFINRAMNPVNYANNKVDFDWRRDELNIVLSFSGFYIRDNGEVYHSKKETTLKGARARAGHLKSLLEDRKVHHEVLKFNNLKIDTLLWGKLFKENKMILNNSAVIAEQNLLKKIIFTQY